MIISIWTDAFICKGCDIFFLSEIIGLGELGTCQFKLLNMLYPENNSIQMEEEYQASTKLFELIEGIYTYILVCVSLVNPFWSYLTPHL